MHKEKITAFAEWFFVTLFFLLCYVLLAEKIIGKIEEGSTYYWLRIALWHTAMLFMFIIIIRYRERKLLRRYLRMLTPLFSSTLLMTPLLLFLLLFLAGILSAAGYPSIAPQYSISFQPFIFLVLLLAAYTEEILFRLYCISRLLDSGMPTWLTIIISSAVFSLIHGQEAWLHSALAGLILAGFWYATKNTHLTALAHAGYNIVLLFIM